MWQRALFVLVLLACAACGASGGSQGSGGPGTVTLTGTVQLPSETPATSNVNAPSKALSIDRVSASETFDIELYSADGSLVATTQTNVSGEYMFSGLNPSLFTNAGDARFSTFILHASRGEGASAVSLTTVVNDLTDGLIRSGISRNNFSEASEMAAYQTTQAAGIATLGSAGSISQRALRLEGGDESDDNATATGEAAIADANSTDDLDPRTIDDACALLLLALHETIATPVGGLSPADTTQALLGLTPGTPGEEAIISFLRTRQNFVDRDADSLTSNLETAVETLSSYHQVVDEIWSDSDRLRDLTVENDEKGDIFLRANLINKTPAEMQTANASDELVSTALDLIEDLDPTVLLSDTRTNNDLARDLGKILVPTVVTSASDNSDVKKVLQAGLPSLLTGDADAVEKRTSVMGAALAAKATDAPFFATFLKDDGEADLDEFNRVIGFFDQGIETGVLDAFLAKQTTFDWGALWNGIDRDKDYGSLSDKDFENETSGLFSTTEQKLDPDSCKGSCGSITPSGLGCDDGCAKRGDCAPDKEEICG